MKEAKKLEVTAYNSRPIEVGLKELLKNARHLVGRVDRAGSSRDKRGAEFRFWVAAQSGVTAVSVPRPTGRQELRKWLVCVLLHPLHPARCTLHLYQRLGK